MHDFDYERWRNRYPEAQSVKSQAAFRQLLGGRLYDLPSETLPYASPYGTATVCIPSEAP